MKKKSLSKNIVAVDLFCGVGGLTHGLSRAGINVIMGVDNDPSCRFPYEKNNSAKFILKPIEDLNPREITSAWGKDKFRLLAGCAPCQPFSKYSQAWDPSSDDRWPLLLEFSRLIKKTKPDFVTMENVPELSRQSIFKDFLNVLKKENFNVHWEVINCQDIGVPQIRRRLVLLASRHGPIDLVRPRLRYNRCRSLREAIGDLPAVKAGEAHIEDPLHLSSALSKLNMQRIIVSKPGGTWREWPKKLRTACHSRSSGSGYVSVYGRMTWDDPAPTMTTQFYAYGSGRFGHPQQDRAITLREGAIIQGFPRNYKFVEPGRVIRIKTLGRLIGNAVPVQLAEVIGNSIVKHVEDIERV